MTTVLQAAGAKDEKDSRWSPIFTNRFFLGIVTNRNPLRSPTGVIYEKYYQLGGTDALIDGQNVEVSERLTICRRPGNTAGLTPYISSSVVPGVIDSFYSFHELGGTIRVFADTPTAIYLVGGYTNGNGTASQGVIPIFTKTGTVTQTFFQGVGQSLYFSDTVEQQKWLDFGIGNPGNSFTTITNTSLTANVATITSQNNFAVGQTVVISQTTNGGGAFNGTFTITQANTTQFQFSLTHADIASAADTGFANATWNWGITAPGVAPTLNIVASGAAAVVWQASTVYSTMGLIHDNVTGTAQQLISVNADGSNPNSQYGTSGNGEPPWNQNPGGTTLDTTGGGTITWTNWGPIASWGAGKVFNNNAVGGTLANPAIIYDPKTGHLQGNGAPGFAQGTTDGSYPNFTGVIGSNVWDGTVKWYDLGPVGRWQPSHSYPAFANNNPTLASHAIAEPILPSNGNTQTVFLQISGGGTSGSGYAPAFQAAAGSQVTDNQLIWISQGSDTWTALTNYSAWSGTQATFGVVKDSNGNMQVCTQTGATGSTQPVAQWQAGHVYPLNATIGDPNGYVQKVTTGGTSGVTKTLTNTVLTAGVATYTASAAHGYTSGQQVTVTGSTHNATFNVVNAIITSTPSGTTFTVNISHDDIGAGADTGTAKAGPTWNQTVGGTTTDGTVTWTNQGLENSGGRPTAWGFAYGDHTADGSVVWTCVGPPVTWAVNTIWHLPSAGFIPPSATSPYGGSQVIGSGFVQAAITSGKSGLVQPTWSVISQNFVLDPSTSNTQITWRNVAAQAANSISWTKGYGYVYAFKARSAVDLYSPQSIGGGGVLLGSSASTPSPAVDQGTFPTGSADGSVSTASPSVQMAAGANAGSVVYVSGIGSTDPQVDTISIFRTFDGGATYFWLTDIKNPSPINGVAQPWQFQDFLPDVANNLFAGLNTLVVAPINHSNDPPLPGAINMTQYFGRIFYSVGATVYASQGPNVGGSSQPPGNGYTAFNPGQFFTFPSTVTREVPTNIGLLIFTTSDLGIVSGGPLISAMYPNIYIPGLGLTSYNALTVRGGLIDLFTADSQVVTLDPNQGVAGTGKSIADQLSVYNGRSTTFSPSSAYVSFHSQGHNDAALFVADGSTGWFRCVTTPAPDSAISGPLWSPKANIVGGVKAIASLEVAPGQHALLMGSTTSNQPVLVRDSTYTTFSDNGSAYPANFTFGSMVLANPGQLAEVGFITCEFFKKGTSPRLAVLLDEVVDSVMTITAAAQSGSNTTYTYTLVSGFAPVVGQGVTITGMANSGNNGTFIITGIGGNTFTVINSSGVNATLQSGSSTSFEDLSAYVLPTGLPPQDSPWRYGATRQGSSLYTNRYYLAQSVGGIAPPQGTFCRHMQVKVDFGSTDTIQNEMLSQTVYGSHWNEK